MSVDREGIKAAYDDVRSDNSETCWALFCYSEDGKSIVYSKSGVEYSEFLEYLTDDGRSYAFVRIEAGDEMSKRAKFVLITWIGKDVSTLKKAKVSTDKSFIKNICNNYAVEVLTSDKEELEKGHIMSLVQKAGGANYGTGVRN